MIRARSITWRLAALFALATSAVLLVLGLAVSVTIDRHFEATDRQTLATALARVERVARAIDTAPQLAELHERVHAVALGHDPVQVWIARANGERLVWDAALTLPAALLEPAPAPAAAAPLLTWQNHDAGGGTWRGLHRRVASGVPGEPPLQAWAAIPIDHHLHFLADFRGTLWVAVALAMALMGALGAAITRAEMAALRQLTEHAQRMSTERLGQTLDTRGVPVELVDLAAAYNQMLGRLDEAFQRLRHFSSDLAHELRTPVNALLVQTQVALAQPRSLEATRDALATNAEALDALARLIGDMLFLAQADNGLAVPRREPVDLRVEAQAVLDFHDALADDAGVRLALAGTATTIGDHAMLRRALANLVSNAIRHTPRGGSVRVRLSPDGDGGGVSVAVDNDGTPLPAAALAHVGERFFRTDEARQRDPLGQGVGLGLAITRSIAAAHGGTLHAQALAAGNRFELRLPASTPA